MHGINVQAEIRLIVIGNVILSFLKSILEATASRFQPVLQSSARTLWADRSFQYFTLICVNCSVSTHINQNQTLLVIA